MHSLYIVFAIIIWSSLGVFVRLADVDVHLVIIYSSLFSICFQSLIFLFPSIRNEIPSIKKMPFIAILSFLLLINTFTFLLAYAKTSVSNAVFTHYIAPVIVAILAAIFLKERITASVIFSIILASVGLVIMLGGVSSVESFWPIFKNGLGFSSDLIGIASGLTSGIAYAFLIILVRVFTQRFNPFILVFFQNAFIALILLPFIRYVPFNKLVLFAIMGAMHSTLAPYLYYHGLKVVQANRAAILGYIEPLGAIIFGMFFLYEYPGKMSIIGGLLIIISGYIIIRTNSENKPWVRKECG